MDQRPALVIPEPRSGPVTAVDFGSIVLILATICVFVLPILIYFPPMLPSTTEALLQSHTPIGQAPVPASLSSSSSSSSSRKKKSDKSNSQGTVQSLCIYPIKSCKGISLTQSKVLASGLEFDRIYTFAQLRSPFPLSATSTSTTTTIPDEKNQQHTWEFITQRQFPLLATLTTDLFLPDPAKPSLGTEPDANPYLILRFPWIDPGLYGLLNYSLAKLARGWRALPEREVLLPVTFPDLEEIAARGYVFEEVKIWRDTVRALDMSVEVPGELARYLGVSNRLGLFRVDPEGLRRVERCAPGRGEVGYQPCTGFQDAYPLHLLNLSSVRDLDEKVPKDDQLGHIDARRFRANIIVDGVPAYEEETWKSIKLIPRKESNRTAASFHVSCRTVRCKMPNVDQDTGLRHPAEPDRSLRKHREVDAGAKNKGCLGMQLTPLFGDYDSNSNIKMPKKPLPTEALETWIEVGSSVEVLSWGEHVYIAQ